MTIVVKFLPVPLVSNNVSSTHTKSKKSKNKLFEEGGIASNLLHRTYPTAQLSILDKESVKHSVQIFHVFCV